MDRLTPITPGELLDQEFLQPLGISQYRLAKAIAVPASRISEIVTGQRAISADTDLRLCRFLKKLSSQSFMVDAIRSRRCGTRCNYGIPASSLAT
jgi:addiction module HigA family antidote